MTRGCDKGPGSGVWGRHLDREFGLGMQEMGICGWGCGGR